MSRSSTTCTDKISNIQQAQANKRKKFDKRTAGAITYSVGDTSMDSFIGSPQSELRTSKISKVINIISGLVHSRTHAKWWLFFDWHCLWSQWKVQWQDWNSWRGDHLAFELCHQCADPVMERCHTMKRVEAYQNLSNLLGKPNQAYFLGARCDRADGEFPPRK